ncbi:hypothetical protein GCM10023323_75440 [Streptomyces thinghirensis]|uniref:Uncharacterized protein n=1 Tax=Streptomyces thinghirensis TaxID=551547 RepID=A0ABP9TJF3_9ACTN
MQDGRTVAVVHAGAQVNTGVLDQSCVDPQSAGRVMVAANHDQRDLKTGELLENPFELVDRIKRRDGTVENITCNDHGLNLFSLHRVQQMLQEGTLLVHEEDSVQLSA